MAESTDHTRLTFAATESDIWRPRPATNRLAEIAVEALVAKGRAVLRKFTGEPRDVPRQQLLKTDHPALAKWRNARLGSPGKPADLGNIDWGYVAKHEHEIPFLGLKEYWYPALQDADLPNNKPVSKLICGERLVFFRDADGAAAAVEDRCPHRGPMLSLGQVGVFAPGTISCRYHGMTFDKSGLCVAVLADGPDSRACGAVKVRAYPVKEIGSLVWVYMGENDPPEILESIPRLREITEGRDMLVHTLQMPFSYLNTLDNAVDMAHPGCLHRSCLPFASQKIHVGVRHEPVGEWGVKAYTTDAEGNYDEAGSWHDGVMHIKESQWFPPNIAFFRPESFGLAKLQGDDAEFGYFWAVPNDIGSATGWLIMSQPKFRNPLKRIAFTFMHNMLHGVFFKWPGSNLSCIDHADSVMMQSQGIIANWDRDILLRLDVATAQVRRNVKALHRKEVAQVAERGRIVPDHLRPERQRAAAGQPLERKPEKSDV